MQKRVSPVFLGSTRMMILPELGGPRVMTSPWPGAITYFDRLMFICLSSFRKSLVLADADEMPNAALSGPPKGVSVSSAWFSRSGAEGRHEPLSAAFSLSEAKGERADEPRGRPGGPPAKQKGRGG